jgi:hypothetical protein
MGGVSKAKETDSDQETSSVLSGKALLQRRSDSDFYANASFSPVRNCNAMCSAAVIEPLPGDRRHSQTRSRKGKTMFNRWRFRADVFTPGADQRYVAVLSTMMSIAVISGNSSQIDRRIVKMGSATMASIQEEILEEFYSKLSKADGFDKERVEQLRALFSGRRSQRRPTSSRRSPKTRRKASRDPAGLDI